MFDFGTALRALKDGSRVARKGWNGKGMWLALVRPQSKFDGFDVQPHHKTVKTSYAAVGDEIEGLTCLPWIGMCTADNSFVPWLASQTDMLAEDWVILAPPVDRILVETGLDEAISAAALELRAMLGRGELRLRGDEEEAAMSGAVVAVVRHTVRHRKDVVWTDDLEQAVRRAAVQKLKVIGVLK